MNQPTILHHQIQGEGPVLFILHGLFGSLRNWQTLAKRYSEKFTVISVDARNHGRSFHSDEMSYAAMADDLEQLAGYLNINQYHLLGHSMGGKVAIRVARQFPDQVASLIVADIAPIPYQHSHDHLIEPILAIDLHNVSKRQEVDALLKRDINDPALRSFLLHNLAQVDGQWRWNVNWQVIKNNMELLLGSPVDDNNWQIHCPALVIYGAQSDYLSDAGKAAYQQHFDLLTYSKIEAAGHWLHAEKPDIFFSKTIDFLQS